MQNQFDAKNEKEELSIVMYIAFVLIYLIPYAIINHLPLHRSVIPFLPGEAWVPFLPWTFVIYISVFIQGLIVMRIMPRKMLQKAMLFTGGMVFVALILFVIFPIEYPRMLYTSENPLVAIFRLTDGPGNCFPSLHVGITMIFSFCYMLKQKSAWKKALMWFWTAAICVSVLTTKQHYIIDILGGIAISLPCMYLINKYSTKS